MIDASVKLASTPSPPRHLGSAPCSPVDFQTLPSPPDRWAATHAQKAQLNHYLSTLGPEAIAQAAQDEPPRWMSKDGSFVSPPGSDEEGVDPLLAPTVPI